MAISTHAHAPLISLHIYVCHPPPPGFYIDFEFGGDCLKRCLGGSGCMLLK